MRASNAVRGLTSTVKGAVNLGSEVKEAWNSGETVGQSIQNVGKVASKKIEEAKDWIKITAARQRAWSEFINEVASKGMGVIRDQNGVYFVLTNKDKTYMYDFNNKCITKDTNGNNIPYDRKTATEAYNLNGDLIWSKEICKEPLYFDDYLIYMMNEL